MGAGDLHRPAGGKGWGLQRAGVWLLEQGCYLPRITGSSRRGGGARLRGSLWVPHVPPSQVGRCLCNQRRANTVSGAGVIFRTVTAGPQLLALPGHSPEREVVTGEMDTPSSCTHRTGSGEGDPRGLRTQDDGPAPGRGRRPPGKGGDRASEHSLCLHVDLPHPLAPPRQAGRRQTFPGSYSSAKEATSASQPPPIPLSFLL